ncbi:hypothetical protein ABT112_33245 [Streptomyces sp. NPDC002055]|uniref:hypothetical protein n=1 Tax=Streptomyces sp. NPDC002055 TaxID=3154534 RepID=UPI003324F2E1
MTVEQIHERLVAAGGLEPSEDSVRALSTEEQLAALRRDELRRIWSLMLDAGWLTYSPDGDPAVQRWHQERLEQWARESGEAGPGPELIRYRIVAQRTDPAHPGASVTTNYAYGRSVEEAVAKARRVLERPDGLYGDRGMYRVVQVTEESLSVEMRQQEEARRRYLTTILEAAVATVRGREVDDPDGELLSRLDDFFTRAVVFPDPHNGGVRPRPHQATFGWTSEPPGVEHASDPGRALAVFLLAYLDHYGLSLVQSPAECNGSHEPGCHRLEVFVRETVLPRTHPNTMERRRVLEALGEAGGLCTARTIEFSSGDVILCTREADHFEGEAPRREEPEGWHKCNARTWIDDQPYNHPHTPRPGRSGRVS